VQDLIIPQLDEKIKSLYELMSPCVLCPRECRVLRNQGQKGYCRAGMRVKISSTGPHHGEEPPISGIHGSGTIFLSYCTMKCRFCQNFQISQQDNGHEVGVPELAKIMLNLEKRKCHNINLVTPTHFLPQIVHATSIARANGLSVPILMNDSGYEKVEVLRLLEGYVDIYMPDAKYSSDNMAKECSDVSDYVENNRLALLEMHRQVGDLVIEDGLVKKGLLIRHLVLPENRAGSADVLSWIAKNMKNVYISLMSQYFPSHRAMEITGLDRRITEEEYDEALRALEEACLENGWVQPLED
jgi:putative pyruvate formate lyase activating enzyme